jgi:4-hydroxy-tetrahydrodipicolinate synthase
MPGARPWSGVLVAAALPFRSDADDLPIDHDAYAAHVQWLAAEGCDGVVPNGSLGEYQTLTPAERAATVETAVKAAPPGFTVIPGIAAYGSVEARRWAEHAAEAGCPAVMLLPPNSYRADQRSVVAHYRAVASVGLPVVAYNNPFDTKVDLVPELLAELHAEGLIAAVKEFSGDPRRAYRIAELAPGLDVLCGSDDLALELAVAGAPGWIAGYPNALPALSARLWKLATSANPADAVPLYRSLHPLLRWDAQTEFVQAIKLSMDVAGRPGGPVRPPRVPLAAGDEDFVRRQTERVLSETGR